MKVIKPQRLGVLTRVFEYKGECRMAVAVLIFFPFAEPDAVLPEVALWKVVPKELGNEGILDAGMPKVRGEFVLTAKAFAPHGTPVARLGVRARVGTLDKTLHAHGDRVWGSVTATAPQPFTELTLTWSNAYGGEGYPSNPLGKGFAPVDGPSGRVHPLPNIEDPRQPLRARTDRPPPSGFGAMDITWPQRASKAGTYDQRWLEERFPGIPDDADWTMFNTAADDQQLRQGFFEGGEEFTLENMHPSRPVLEGSLPRLAARAFVTLRTPNGQQFTEVPTRLETVHLFPHLERGVAIFRGVVGVTEDDGEDVLHLVAALERPEAPRGSAYYSDLLTRRLDRKQGALEALRDQDLLPALPTFAETVQAEKDDTTALVTSEGLMRQNLRRRLEAAHAALRERVAAAGFDPDVHVAPLPPPPPPVQLEDMPAIMAHAHEQIDAEKSSREAQQAEAAEQLRAQCAQNGLDYDAVVASRRRRAGAPEDQGSALLKASVDAVDAARTASADPASLPSSSQDPATLEKLAQAAAAAREGYRRSAHFLEAPRDADGGEPGMLRERVLALLRSGGTLDGYDLSYADLSGLDLRGVSLRGTVLEAANLSGARLDGACLSHAVMARADLSGASLDGATLQGANLGRAVLRGAHAVGADFTAAILHTADLGGASLRDAILVRADLTDAQTQNLDLAGISAPGMRVLRSSVAGVCFAGANLTKAVFIEADVRRADFTRATLTSANFVTTQGDGAVFCEADCAKMVFVKDSSFVGADFSRARLSQANLRGTPMRASNFSSAFLVGADLSLCDLRGSRFDGANATEARFVRADLTETSFVRADLMMADFQKATIEGVSLDGSNVFRADMARVRGRARSTRGANLKGVRIHPRSR